MIKPTVGRVVYFYPASNVQDAGFCPPSAGEPCAAIIAKVWRDDCVNLTVFDASGVAHARTSVMLVQENEPHPENGYFCEWMPFQIGHAKKA